MRFSAVKLRSWMQGFPLHPFVFAIYPILALLAFNISQVGFSSGLRPLLCSVFVAGFLTLAFYAIFRDWKRAALISTILLLLFYSYGHVYLLLKGIKLA